MSEREQERKEQYQRARADFDELNSEDKVVFLVEAAVTTLARGIDALGHAVSEEINNAFSKRSRRKKEAEGEEATDDQGSASKNGHADADAAPGTDASTGDEAAGSTPSEDKERGEEGVDDQESDDQESDDQESDDIRS